MNKELPYKQARCLNTEEEEAHLMVTLRGNGYPSSFIRSAAAARAPREESTTQE